MYSRRLLSNSPDVRRLLQQREFDCPLPWRLVRVQLVRVQVVRVQTVAVDANGLRRKVLATLSTLALATLTACTSRPANGLELTACRIGNPDIPARCGAVTVPENATVPQGRRLSIHFAVLPATGAGSAGPPLLILVGGPGQAATTSGVPIARQLSKLRRTRDLVLVDQRGTGASNALRCHEEDPPFADRFSKMPSPEDIAACHDALDADTTQYTTLAALGDYEAVRLALGHARWDLWGGSYGTRVALAYMQFHPDSVNRVVLDGAAPTDVELPLHFAADGQASLDRVAQDCARQPDCAAAHPRFETHLAEVLERFGGGPLTVQIVHPSRGTAERLPMTRDGFLGGLRTLLYSSELISLLPFALERAHRDDWSAFVASVTAISDMMTDQVSHLGMYLSVVCAEDVPRISDDEVAALTNGTVFGKTLVEQARTWCESWASSEMPLDYYEPVRQRHPTLILSGARDPATPPRWGHLVASRLPNALHVVTLGSHGVTPLGCAPEVIAGFLLSEDPASTDVRCLAELEPLPFFTGPTGP